MNWPQSVSPVKSADGEDHPGGDVGARSRPTFLAVGPLGRRRAAVPLWTTSTFT